MLICKHANLAFVQIPKNATKSVKVALAASFGLDHSAVAKDLGWSVEKFCETYSRGGRKAVYHPALGAGNIDHLPLSYWAELFPHTWAAMRAANSFAMVRDPRRHFISALLQHLGQFNDMKYLRVDDPVVREEASRVCSWLDGRGRFHDPQYIHFTRQSDYVDLDGKRIVSAIFPLDRMDAAAKWIESKTGTAIDITHTHSRREPKKWAMVLRRPARFVGRYLTPESIKQKLYPIWRRSSAFTNASQRYDAVNLGADVEQFIATFYAADAALFAEARASVAKPATSNPVVGDE